MDPYEFPMSHNEIQFNLKRAQYCYENENYTKAFELSNVALKIIAEEQGEVVRDDLGWALRLRAGCYLNRNELENAINDADRAIRINPNNSFIWTVRGETYFRKKDYDKAIEDLSIAIELDPYYEYARIVRADSYDCKKDYDKAIEDFTIAIKNDPENAYALNSRGLDFMNQGKYELALVDLNQSLEIEPNNAWAIAQCGIVHKRMGWYEEAINDFRKALEIDKDLEWVRVSLAECQRMENSNQIIEDGLGDGLGDCDEFDSRVETFGE
ncbi:MAG: tetratricopeptide repeat protein [Anaerolineales bacterium]|nr:tetratricopeptide repeat protein [Anaerolineales bacterium]